jgi:putative membrane protein
MNHSDVAELENIHLRLHWSSLVFDAISQIRTLILPVILLLFGAARGENFWLIIGAASVVPTMIYSVIRYITLRFQIDNGQMIVKHGLIFRNVRSIPITKIQNIDFVQNPLHRLLGVAEVRVETASGSEPEATLRVLKLEQVERLRAEIFEQRQIDSLESHDIGAPSTTNSGSEFASEVGTEGVVPSGFALANIQVQPIAILQIPASWLFYAGLASNRGALLIGVLFAFAFEANIFKRLDFQKLRQLIPANLGTAMMIVSAIAIFVALMVLLRLLGIIWYQLRFHGYTLTRKGDDLRISCGMFTKVQATVPRQRIQFISVQSNLIMRLLGFSAVRIETASSGKNLEDATQSVSSRWFVPIVPNDRLAELIGQIRPGLTWDDNAFQFQPISSRAAKRISRLAVLIAIILCAAGLIYSRPWGALVGVVALPAFLWVFRKGVHCTKFATTTDGVVFRSGVFTTKTSMTFFEKIQSLEVTQTPFDRRWGMAKLVLDTAAAGPAEHVIEIGMLDQSVAFEEHQTIKRLAALHQPVFQ